ncbi:MAG: metallophosphoesterase [Deltaproteobacteria bacterium]|nr:metallophosphoesterase [Deltaproteobacteria bacterium]
MSGASLLMGAVLTFATVDGSAVSLTVSLSDTATAALTWGDHVYTSSVAQRRHLFSPLPMPTAAPLVYDLSVAGASAHRATVKPIPQDGLRVAVYGDSRDGHGPHRQIMQAIREWDPHVLVHTGDVVQRAGVAEEWANYLAASLPVSDHVPLVLALGNHELYQPWNLPKAERVDALAEAMAQVPPPDDAISRRIGAGPATFRVRVGPMLIVSLNSNVSMSAQSQQLRFLRDVSARDPDARFRVAAMHHGPASSGAHGKHRDAADMIAAFKETGVTLSLAGHDHLYERIARDGITYVVSGGGGAPLYQRRHLEPGSEAFASTYNWTKVTVEGDALALESRSLEGAVLDRAVLRPSAPPPPLQVPWIRWAGAGGLLVAGLLAALWRLARGPRTG